MTKLDQAKINDIIRTFIQETLDFDEDVRTNRKAPFSLEEIDQRADFIGSLRPEKQEDLAKCDYRSAASAVDTVIQNHGLQVTKSSEDYNRLSREVLKAEIAMLEVEQKRTLGSHTLRKTFGYRQRVTFGVGIPELMVTFNHSSQRETLEYLCIQDEEVKCIYMNEI